MLKVWIVLNVLFFCVLLEHWTRNKDKIQRDESKAADFLLAFLALVLSCTACGVVWLLFR